MNTSGFSSKIKEDEWICPYCNNINNTPLHYCVSCGKLQPNKLLIRVPFVIFTVMLFLSFGFWIYKYVCCEQFFEYHKLIAIFFTFAIPLLLFSVGSLVFVIEFFKTTELRENPNKLVHSNPQIRIEAVKNLENDDDLLLKLLTSEKNSVVKEEIVGKIKDINQLKKVALKDKDENVRKKAISVIFDEIIMMEIISKEPIAELRKEALKKVTTQKYLIETATKDSDSDVRKEAIKKIVDQSALIEIANNEKEIIVRQEALNKITNKTVVNEILKKSNNKELNIFITNLNKITSISVFEKELKNILLPFVHEPWFLYNYIDLLYKLKWIPKSDLKIQMTISLLTQIGLFFGNNEIEIIFKSIISENQKYYNKYFEDNYTQLKQLNKTTFSFMNSLYFKI